MQAAHACCQVGDPSDTTAHANPAGNTSQPLISSEQDVATLLYKWPADQQDGDPQSAMACCDTSPRAEVRRVANHRQDSTPVASLRQFINLDPPPNTPAARRNDHQPRRSRPIYLAFSCLLI